MPQPLSPVAFPGKAYPWGGTGRHLCRPPESPTRFSRASLSRILHVSLSLSLVSFFFLFLSCHLSSFSFISLFAPHFLHLPSSLFSPYPRPDTRLSCLAGRKQQTGGNRWLLPKPFPPFPPQASFYSRRHWDSLAAGSWPVAQVQAPTGTIHSPSPLQ